MTAWILIAVYVVGYIVCCALIARDMVKGLDRDEYKNQVATTAAIISTLWPFLAASLLIMGPLWAVGRGIMFACEFIENKWRKNEANK